jgi:8-oxo-dGTP diphosphatase
VSKAIHVAVGVILDAQQNILIALRPNDSHQGGLWEFPGGKVEMGETVQQALARELNEELGIKAAAFRPLITINHNYGDKVVQLDVCWVDAFGGCPKGCEGQPVKWVAASMLTHYEFPKANQSIITAVIASLVA